MRFDGADDSGRIGDGELVGGEIEFQREISGGRPDGDGSGGVLQLNLFEFGGELECECAAADPGAAPVAGAGQTGLFRAAVFPQQAVDLVDGLRSPGGDEVVIGDRFPEFFRKAVIPARFQGGGQLKFSAASPEENAETAVCDRQAGMLPGEGKIERKGVMSHDNGSSYYSVRGYMVSRRITFEMIRCVLVKSGCRPSMAAISSSASSCAISSRLGERVVKW